MANTVYDNFILENKIDSILTTAIDMNQYMTIDNSLTQEAGMKKTVHTYKATGSVQDVAEGAGNTTSIEAGYTSKDYEVITTQGRFVYTDEAAMKDPTLVDVGIQGMTDTMTNDLTAKAVAEFGKATLITYSNTWTFANFVDAIAAYPYEAEDGLTFLINPAQKAAIRKNLEDDLKYSEGFARTGYIGSVCGVPVVTSKAVPAGTVYLVSAKAVTCFVKKGVEVEQDREKNTRTNTVYGRKVMVIALTDSTRVVKMVATAQG